MFTSIRLKNFKSFGDIYFDFRKKRNEAKKFVAIYGENGSGKTNLVSGFEFLCNSLHSFRNIELIRELQEKSSKLNDNDLFYDFVKLVNTFEFNKYIKDCRMIGANDDTEIEYGFIVNGVEGKYRVVFNDTIVFEELYYLIDKRRGKLFTISKDEKKINKEINNSIFTDKKFYNDFIDELDKYWGKHSFLGIMVNLIETQNIQYIKSKISKSIYDVVSNFQMTYIMNKTNEDIQTGYICGNSKFSLFNMMNGSIPIEQKKKLDFCENILCEYFTQLYSDIQAVYYERIEVEGRINYKLYVKKTIAGQLRDIPFNIESTGTQKILKIVHALLAAMNNITVIYDEIDTGVHDMLMEDVIRSVLEYINGQLIITTHNTLLLEKIDSKSIYVIYIDYKGNKEARCLADYNIRIQGNNNIRDMYLKGLFGGIPYSEDMDCSHISEVINSKDGENTENEETIN